MASSSAVRTLRLSQRVSVQAWRALMRVVALGSRLRRTSPPGRIWQHAYGSHRDEELEIIEPRSGLPQRAPVVYVHGGGWICGKKEAYTGELLFLAEAGYRVFNLEYPVAPENPHPRMLRSLFSALAWIRDRHPDPGAVHLVGDSAGGNLVMMLAILTANPGLLKGLGAEPLGVVPPSVRSVVSIYGVLDRLSWIERRFPSAALMLECYAGPDALEREVAPEIAVTPMDLAFEQLPPAFIAAGSKDQLAESSRLCAERPRAEFDGVEYKEYPGEAHGFFNRSSRPASQELRRDILAFLAAHG